MRRPHIRKASVATVAGAAAVVIALGGTSAYAATLITSKQIKNNTIKSIDVRDGALTGVDVANGSLTGADLAPGTVPAPYAGTFAYSTYHDAGVNYQNGATVLSLNVPTAGSYVINASTWLNNGGSQSVLARCILAAGGDSDTKRAYLEPPALGAASYATVALQAVHTFSAPGTATLFCDNFGVAGSANDSKITAVKVDHLSNIPG